MLHLSLILVVTLSLSYSCAEECTFNSVNGVTNLKIVYDTARLQLNLVNTDPTSGNVKELSIMDHSETNPSVYIGKGKSDFTEYRGNFNVTDFLNEKLALPYFEIVKNGTTCDAIIFKNTDDDGATGVRGSRNASISFATTPTSQEGVSLVIGSRAEGYDRFWIRYVSGPMEQVYGGGTQFSHFNLKGKAYPIWTREQGVGRNKATQMTFWADSQDGGAGGDYHTTYWPQPMYYTAQYYSVVMTSSKYSVFDFTQDDFHEIQVWDDQSFRFDFLASQTWTELVTKSTEYLIGDTDRQRVPRWSYNGGILGLQGGTDIVMDYYNKAVKQNVKVSGIWIQDWVGQIKTSFGTRLFWDWKLNEERYPNITKIMEEKAKEGVFFTAYINPYLNTEGTLYAEAASKGYLVMRKDGSVHYSDFGEFYCGTVDLTNPAAYDWYKNVIKTNMIQVGFRGWMADFGEYMPIDDQVFYDGRTPAELHNLWPSLWAKVNYDAIQESRMAGEIFVWMRAGHTESSKYAIANWAGDQNVDWSLDDGLISVVPAALSVGMSGVGVSHFDIGGFTSLYGVVRTQELLFRSAELAVFTPTMRTHEGNRPAENWQIYKDDYTMEWFGRLTRLHHHLINYTETLINEYYETGVPVQRPIFLEYECDDSCYNSKFLQDQYMYGHDLLVAPIYTEGVNERQVYFPRGEVWINIWNQQNKTDATSKAITGIRPGKMGEPPVFYRQGSAFEYIFSEFTSMRAGQYPPPLSGFTSTTPSIFVALAVAIIANWLQNMM